MNAIFPLLCASLLLLSARSVNAQLQHLSIPVPGGMPGTPLITGVEHGTNGYTVTWDGPPGYYQLFEKSDLRYTTWTAVGPRTNLARRATFNTTLSNVFFRISGPGPKYVGARACLECHQAIHQKETNTLHAHAFELLQAAGQQNNPSCLPCHSVGYNLPTGFSSETATPHLKGVQCESCHGPAGNHAANPDDLAVRPRSELASALCGGCHSGTGHATLDDWNTSEHQEIVVDLNPADRINACGRCHSGSARLSLIKQRPLPAGDANVPVTCAVCHDPHSKTGNPAQLRNPISSTNNFTLTTSEAFSVKYSASTNINICAQCHNDRGSSWTTSNAPPHFSLQYNFLLGNVGVLKTGPATYNPASHALKIENQCVGCHMQTNGFNTNGNTFIAGHTFRADTYTMCKDCHPDPAGLVELARIGTPYQIASVKDGLDYWATNKAPAALRVYGPRAWEYTSPGELSSAGPGPSPSEQALIPVNIQKARYNLYLVQRDGSYGIHNARYVNVLLNAAREWVAEELAK